ncbi:hypothetical protein OE88DRAFT_1730910 [Heliocybe sulcata]|uniref:Uncharacterized protein n=1 Tax=Heliocybe sulcata TaxID=5364 RepID=A0A5C3NN13_9AGAM|nr:hypothetical protein OE88DRAFT_1730910 [Heliocybe sulcata]
MSPTFPASSPTPTTPSICLPPSEETLVPASASGRPRSVSQPASASRASNFLSCSVSSIKRRPSLRLLGRARSGSDPTHHRSKEDTSKEGPELESTKARVERAAASALDISVDVVREALFTGSHLLELAPVLGLHEAVETLLVIWENCRQVERNRAACCQLTQRCADTLADVKAEIDAAGAEVAGDLQCAVGSLTRAFDNVRELLQNQNQQGRFKRYLKRDEMTREIAGCHRDLDTAMARFTISLNIKTHKSVRALAAGEERRRAAERELLLACEAMRSLCSSPSMSLAFPPPQYAVSTSPSMTLPTSPSLLPELSASPSASPITSPEPFTPTPAGASYFQATLDQCCDEAPRKAAERSDMDYVAYQI